MLLCCTDAFPVDSEETARITDTARIIRSCSKELDSPPGVVRRKQQHNNHNHITMSLYNAGMQYLLAVMFSNFPVEKRRNAEINTILTSYTSLREVLKACNSHAEVDGMEKQQHISITTTSQSH